MPSFDIVSEVDLHEFSNAVDQAARVVDTRFDFKAVDASFERSELSVTVFAESTMQLEQMQDMLRSALVKCSIDPKAMQAGDEQTAGKQVKVEITMQNGLESVLAKKITKLIKDQKMKVQTQIQGEQVRVTGKKRDDLQQVIALLKEQDFDQPLQFNNFRD